MPQSLQSPIVDSVYTSRTLFDRNSRSIRLSRPLGDFVEYEYDGLDRATVLRSNSVTGSTDSFVPLEIHSIYDDASNLVQTIEVERSENGRTETFYGDVFYDALGRPRIDSVKSH